MCYILLDAQGADLKFLTSPSLAQYLARRKMYTITEWYHLPPILDILDRGDELQACIPYFASWSLIVGSSQDQDNGDWVLDLLLEDVRHLKPIMSWHTDVVDNSLYYLEWVWWCTDDEPVMSSIHIDDSILFSQTRSNMLGKRAWRGIHWYFFL